VRGRDDAASELFCSALERREGRKGGGAEKEGKRKKGKRKKEKERERERERWWETLW
jgi:hypothetical protein